MYGLWSNQCDMNTNLEIFQEIFDNLKGELVICDFSVYRLIAIVEDEYDYYYLLFDGKELYLFSCLINLVRLKNQIDDDDYSEMIRIVKLNHPDQPGLYEITEEITTLNEEFKKEIISSLRNDVKFIVGPYWDLN